MAKKSHSTRANVLIKRGSLPKQKAMIVDNKPLDSLLRKAEKVGLIIHSASKSTKK